MKECPGYPSWIQSTHTLWSSSMHVQLRCHLQVLRFVLGLLSCILCRPCQVMTWLRDLHMTLPQDALTFPQGLHLCLLSLRESEYLRYRHSVFPTSLHSRGILF